MKLSVAPTHRAEKWAWIILFALAWLAGIGLSLWDQDESAYAGFSWNMLQSGNWLIPEFLWSDIHRKPPLLFWSIGFAFKLFGIHEWVVRFPALLALLGTVLLLRYQAAQVFGTATARLAAWILAANVFLPHLAKQGVTDALLLFFETLAALALVNFFHQPKFKHQALFVVGTAGAMLVKGPPVLILTLGMLGIMLLFSPQRKTILKFHPWLLFPLAAIPLFVWGRMAWLHDDGKLISWMIDWYTFRRVSSDVLGQTGPPGYHFVVLAIGFLPILPFLPSALASHLKQLSLKKSPLKALLLVSWAIAGWVIYELMKSKLPSYAIGAYPAIALMVGTFLTNLSENNTSKPKRFLWGTVVYLLFTLALVVLVFALVQTTIDGKKLFPAHVATLAYVMAACLAIPALAAVWQLFRHQYAWAFRLNMLQSALFLLLAWYALVPSIEQLRGATKSIATFTAENCQQMPVILTNNFHQPSLPFYLGVNGCTYKESPKTRIWLEALHNGKQLLLFNSSNIDQLRKLSAKTGTAFRIEKELPGFITDKGKLTTWYVVRGL